MKHKMIRDIDESIWQRLKILSARLDIKLADIIKMLLEFYEQNGGNDENN